jgi:signal transduction histidine kinase
VDLDARTLIFIVAVFVAMSTLVLSLLWQLHRRIPGIGDWAIGFGLFSAGAFLLFARDTISDLLSVAGGNSLTILGFTTILSGNFRYSGRRVPVWPLACLVAAGSLPFILFHDQPSHYQTRVIASAGSLGLIGFLSAWVLGRAPKGTTGRVNLARRVVAWAYVLFSLLSVARIVMELVWLSPEGRSMWLGQGTVLYYAGATVFCFALAAGVPVMVTELLRDQLRDRVRDVEKARHDAENALREQANFLSMVSHEFRSPLSIIDASTEVISMDLPPDREEAAEEVTRIRRATRRLSNLVEGCITDEWLSTASPTTRPNVIQPRGVLEELAQEYGATLQWSGSEYLTLSGDSYLLPLALSGVIDNGAKYGKTRDNLLIRAHAKEAGPEEDGQLRVDILDDGPGLPAEEAERVFEKYYRAPGGLHKPGTGLGLFLAQRIIGLHGGTISIGDRPDHRPGCLVRITLPIARKGNDNA